MKKLLLMLVTLTLTGCLGMPETVQPVSNFDVQHYLGKWYEIARLDHSFEEGLTHVTADYTPRDDGGIAVLNRGFSAADNQWEEAQGKAYFVNSDSEGYLKVSFFGPFYGSYVIFALDDDYRYAFISGPDTDYLWLLSRTPTVDQQVIEQFIHMAKARGFDTDRLIFVDQQ
ncbi:lipocalin family protein [Vibrio spartinae]|uniref:Outer membrane lipoprotein Blc n=1 Tax=Vibrio spartinae TaxID=1918945 RepID=A0ABX6R222_9VIBR|nr:lipocalin family protein [Vibrio spartinae]QMV15546.1 Outer membrane lipoprotein blc precursor [Vibrio spartinae]